MDNLLILVTHVRLFYKISISLCGTSNDTGLGEMHVKWLWSLYVIYSTHLWSVHSN